MRPKPSESEYCTGWTRDGVDYWCTEYKDLYVMVEDGWNYEDFVSSFEDAAEEDLTDDDYAIIYEVADLIGFDK